jgi:hypothetical protein
MPQYNFTQSKKSKGKFSKTSNNLFAKKKIKSTIPTLPKATSSCTIKCLVTTQPT